MRRVPPFRDRSHDEALPPAHVPRRENPLQNRLQPIAPILRLTMEMSDRNDDQFIVSQAVDHAIRELVTPATPYISALRLPGKWKRHDAFDRLPHVLPKFRPQAGALRFVVENGFPPIVSCGIEKTDRHRDSISLKTCSAGIAFISPAS
jgi:hypothetical protein